MSILDELADYARIRVQEAKEKKPLSQVKTKAESMPKGTFAFEKALKKEKVAFICECKKASPSKGIIAEDFPYLQIAKAYEEAGADAISVLTEPKWFKGELSYLEEICRNVKIPVIRKDFTIDPYMIYEAKVAGASAVLLICAILSEEEIKSYISICDELGLSALVEAHDAGEIEKALRAGARVIGVNNRNLKDFTVNTANATSLRSLVPKDIVFVSESGVSTHEDVAVMRQHGADALLVGEALMRAPDKAQKLAELRGNL